MKTKLRGIYLTIVDNITINIIIIIICSGSVVLNYVFIDRWITAK